MCSVVGKAPTLYAVAWGYIPRPKQVHHVLPIRFPGQDSPMYNTFTYTNICIMILF